MLKTQQNAFFILVNKRKLSFLSYLSFHLHSPVTLKPVDEMLFGVTIRMKSLQYYFHMEVN